MCTEINIPLALLFQECIIQEASRKIMQAYTEQGIHCNKISVEDHLKEVVQKLSLFMHNIRKLEHSRHQR